MKNFILLIIFIPTVVFAKSVKEIRLNEKIVSYLSISSKGAVLSFPTKPSKVILGREGTFSVEYVGSDLAISPTRSNSESNLFVYIEGRRFNFQLRTSGGGYSLILIKDSFDQIERVENVRRKK